MVSIKNKNILFLLIALSLVIIIPTSLFAAQDIIAFFGKVKGDVTVTRANPGETEAAKIGMFLHPGDSIKTGKDSYTSIVFQDDGSRLQLDPNTTLTLDAKRTKKKLSKKLFLGAGKMWAKVTKKRGTDFEVTTPTSVASVKGTDFNMEEKNPAETHLCLVSDYALFSNGIQTVTVYEGQCAVATPETIDVFDAGGEGCNMVPSTGETHELIFQTEEGTRIIIEFDK